VLPPGALFTVDSFPFERIQKKYFFYSENLIHVDKNNNIFFLATTQRGLTMLEMIIGTFEKVRKFFLFYSVIS
jgi:hypothetical protein